jgi:hypothetical protein
VEGRHAAPPLHIARPDGVRVLVQPLLLRTSSWPTARPPIDGFSPQPRFRWPQRARCAVIVSFDVDGETTALSEDPKLTARLTTMSQCTYGPRVGVPRLLELLTHLDVPATFLDRSRYVSSVLLRRKTYTDFTDLKKRIFCAF